MREFGRSVPIVAKLEKPQAIERLEAILEVADGVMVARGDLGVEMPPEQVPLSRSWRPSGRMCRGSRSSRPRRCSVHDREPRPTRAEATDVANAIFDGTDAVMLSGRNHQGRYPARNRGHDGAHHFGGRS